MSTRRPWLAMTAVMLGWVAAAIPEAQGGLQLPRAALAALCEELGKHAFPSAALIACSKVFPSRGRVYFM